MLLTTKVEEAVAAGFPLIFPTETVYGLGVPLSSHEGAKQIYELKQRPLNKPLAAYISSLKMLMELGVELDLRFFKLAEAFLPGPLTIILQRGEGTLGIRYPNHPLALELIERVGEPLLATSANLSGAPDSKCVADVRATFEGKVGAILDGGVCSGIPSTVISLSERPFRLLREGTISEASLLSVLD